MSTSTSAMVLVPVFGVACLVGLSCKREQPPERPAPVELDMFAPDDPSNWTCEDETIIATATADTTYDHVPPGEGVWRYRVRAIDAESHASGWSNSRDRDIATVTAANAPRAYRTDLGANYPNPFNPSTQIPFVVGGAEGSAAAHVTLSIYSVTGARVATLMDGVRAPGTYQGRWNGLTDRGAPVPTGIYFARLSVDGSPAATRKLVLLK